jgi:hypothetical protein
MCRSHNLACQTFALPVMKSQRDSEIVVSRCVGEHTDVCAIEEGYQV